MKRTMLAAALLAAMLLGGCWAQTPPETTMPPQTVPTEPSAPPETTLPAVSAGLPVETPCGTLMLPDNWDEPITWETQLGDPMTISFYAGETALYDLTFSERPGNAMGVVQNEDGPIYVGMTVHPLEDGSDLLLSMQESVNVLISQLAPEPIPADDGEYLVLTTEYGDLYYPAQYGEYLLTRQPFPDSMEFYCCLPEQDPAPLFTVYFGTADRGLSGTITDENGNSTDISIQPDEPDSLDGWSSDETDLYYAMQEAMNDLLRGAE